MEEIVETLPESPLLNPQQYGIFTFVKYLFILASVAMSGAIVYFLFRTKALEESYLKDISEFTKVSPYQDVKIAKNWEKLKEKMVSDDLSERKLAIIEADDIVFSVLNQMGYGGESMKESLEAASSEIVPNKEELLKTHKTRRDMVYDPNFELDTEKAEEMMKVYEETLTDLQVI